MRKFKAVTAAILLTVTMAMAMAGCSSPTCKVSGCNNKPAEILGVKSDYCLLHIGNELLN